jgi:hypothetical protein
VNALATQVRVLGGEPGGEGRQSEGFLLERVIPSE